MLFLSQLTTTITAFCYCVSVGQPVHNGYDCYLLPLPLNNQRKYKPLFVVEILDSTYKMAYFLSLSNYCDIIFAISKELININQTANILSILS